MASNYQLRKALYKQIKSKDLDVDIAVDKFFKLVKLNNNTFLLNIDIQTDKGNITVKGLTKDNFNSYNTTSDIELSVSADNTVYVKNTSASTTTITSTSIELVKGILNESYFDLVETDPEADVIFNSETDKGTFNAVTGSSSRIKNTVSSFSDRLYVGGPSVLNSTLAVNGLATLHSLVITNNTTIGGTLEVTGATTLGNILNVADNLSVGANKFNVIADSGNTSIAGTLGVTGATTLDNTLGITGVTTISNTTESTTKDNGALVVEGGIGVEGNINIGKAANVGTNLNVGGTTNIAGNTTITGTTNLESTLGVEGVTTITNITESTTKDSGALVVEGGVGIEKSVNIGDKLNVENKTTTGSLDVTTDANITRNVNIDNNLTVDGIATIDDLVVTNDVEINGDVDVKGTLLVDEKTTLNDALDVVGIVDLKNETDSSSSTIGALKVAGGVGIAKKLYVGNNTNISGALQADGATTLLSTLGVTGATTLDNILNVGGNLSVGNNKFNVISDSGNTLIGGSLGVDGPTTLGDTLDVAGDIIFGTQDNKATLTYTTDTARTFTIPNTGADADFVMTQGNQTIYGTKTYDSTISGNISGNAGTVTNGVYTTGTQSIAGVKTFTDIPVFNGGATGSTAPFKVDSTFLVKDLNADLLDGQHGSYYAPVASIGNAKITLAAGNGLVNGGDFTTNQSGDDTITFNLGTPSTLSSTSTDTATADSHTHAITSGTLSGTNISVTGNGKLLDSGLTISIPQSVATTADVTFNSVNVTDLTVTGTLLTKDAQQVNLGDNIILLNAEETGSPTENAGIEVKRGTSLNTSLVWNEDNDRWTFTNNGTTYHNIPIPTEYTNNPGTVTSVGLALPTEFTVSNSPVTNSGILTGTWKSQTAKTFFAAPNAAAGTPSFRTIVASDIPTLNQNTTGTAAKADTLKTITTDTVGDFYPTFVNSDNTTADYESVYTDESFYYNPSTNTLNLENLTVTGNTDISGNLEVNGANGIKTSSIQPIASDGVLDIGTQDSITKI